MVAHGPGGVPSRPGGRDHAERLKRLQIVVHKASTHQRRVAAEVAAWGAQPVTRPRRPPVTGIVPAGVRRPPVSGVVPVGVGRRPVNGGAPAGANAECSSEISEVQNGLITMQMHLRAMLRVFNRLVGRSSRIGSPVCCAIVLHVASRQRATFYQCVCADPP
jgi:hypothetical protein